MAREFIILLVWSLFLNSSQQGPSEKLSLSDKQVAETQRILASELDAELPKLPFANWFAQIVGPRAGVIWQLSECGEHLGAPPDSTRDMKACTEANAILPDGRKVVVMIRIGTFKKGMTHTPEYCCGVIEQQGELYLIRRLRDLPELLQSPESLETEVRLPMVTIPKVVMNDIYQAMADLQVWSGRRPSQSLLVEAVPPLPSPQLIPQPSNATSSAKNQNVSEEPGLIATSGAPKLSEAVLWGDAITKAQPQYPPSAKRIKASGQVEVLVTVSKAGRVIDAKAISGHLLLRDAAVEAARQWVFKPAMLKGVPVETQIVLSFVFKPPE
ncbi:MAG: energy transducer TonB [Acidobacteria bacterium]|nr:energy transducer TonB [Acidobacteriota bacterium]